MTWAPIVIVGAGAIGGAIGSALALGGDDVTLVDADHDHADRMLEEQVAHLRRASKSRSGVWRDLAVVRRPTEVAAIYGPVLELATQRGAHIPKLRWLIATIAEIEAGRRVPTTDHLAELRAA